MPKVGWGRAAPLLPSMHRAPQALNPASFSVAAEARVAAQMPPEPSRPMRTRSGQEGGVGYMAKNGSHSAQNPVQPSKHLRSWPDVACGHQGEKRVSQIRC